MLIVGHAGLYTTLGETAKDGGARSAAIATAFLVPGFGAGANSNRHFPQLTQGYCPSRGHAAAAPSGLPGCDGQLRLVMYHKQWGGAGEANFEDRALDGGPACWGWGVSGLTQSLITDQWIASRHSCRSPLRCSTQPTTPIPDVTSIDPDFIIVAGGAIH